MFELSRLREIPLEIALDEPGFAVVIGLFFSVKPSLRYKKRVNGGDFFFFSFLLGVDGLIGVVRCDHLITFPTGP